MKLEAESTVFNDERIVTDVSNAQSTADDAQETASAAKEIADNTVQHFWFVGEGTDTGVHITEVPQSSFVDNPSGGNLLARSNGIAVRDGLTELARFGAASAQIGQDGQSHIELDYHSMKMLDKEGNTYLWISDLRGTDGTAQVQQRDLFNSHDILERLIILAPEAVDTSYTVTVNGSTSGFTIADKSTRGYSISGSLSDGDEIVTTYRTSAEVAKAYTLGVRDSTGVVGVSSVAEGLETISSGYASHAEGLKTEAIGAQAHAEGLGTQAKGSRSHAGGDGTIAWDCQTAIGRYNREHISPTITLSGEEPLFIVGNGTDDDERSDALLVNQNGNIRIALKTSGHTYFESIDRDLYNAIVALDWQSDVIE